MATEFPAVLVGLLLLAGCRDLRLFRAIESASVLVRRGPSNLVNFYISNIGGPDSYIPPLSENLNSSGLQFVEWHTD